MKGVPGACLVASRVWAKAKRGGAFTLVELVAVIVVLAVLAGVAVVAYNDSTKKARETAIRAHFRALTDGLLWWERDSVHSDPEEQTQFDHAGFESSPLVGYFHHSPFSAFSGTWAYIYYGTDIGNMSLIAATGLPPFADTTAEVDQAMLRWANQAGVGTGTINTTGYTLYDQAILPKWRMYRRTSASPDWRISHFWYH